MAWIGKNIGDEELRKLVQKLRSYSTLTMLDLSCDYERSKKWKREKMEEKQTGNSIGAEGCRIISELLKENSTLTKVNLMGYDMRDEWMDYT